MSNNTPTVPEALSEAFQMIPDEVEKVFGFDHYDESLDALQIGNHVFTASRGDEMGGDAEDGFGYTWGIEEDGQYEALVDGQWAHSSAELIQAAVKWADWVSAQIKQGEQKNES